MHTKTAFALGLTLALVGVGLGIMAGLTFPTQAAFAPRREGPPAPAAPDDAFAPSPAAAALPPAEPAAPAALIPFSSAPTPWTLPDPVWRIGVTRDGLYRLAYDTLEMAGVPVSGTATSALRLWHRGLEVAIEVNDVNGNGLFEPQDGLSFYGEKFHGSPQDEKYTDENVYWLSVEAGAAGKRMTSRSVSPLDAPATDMCLTTVVAEQNLRYWARWYDHPGTATTWFWERMVVPVGQVVTSTYPLPLSHIAAAPHTATLLIEVAGKSFDAAINPDHSLRLTLNGTPIGETSWDGEVGHVATFEIPSALLQEGDNALALAVVGTTVAQDVYFDRAELTYLREPVAAEGALTCKVPTTGAHTYTFTGLPAGAQLYDITDPLNPVKLTDHSGFTFQDTVSAGTRYVGGIPAPRAPTFTSYLPLVLRANSGATRDVAPAALAGIPAVASSPAPTLEQYHPDLSLITRTTGADLLIIAPREFHAALQPLITRRQEQELRVALVAEQDLYPLFNGGVYHPEALRAFVAHAYENWPGPAPRYLLLVGGGHFNFKGYAPETFGPPARIWIPPYLEFADPDQGEVPVDARYGDVNGDGLPELMVGRIPANSEAELATYLDKLLAYDALPAASWTETAIFAADDGASSPEPSYADSFRGWIQDQLFPSWVVTHTVYMADYCPKPPASWTAPCPSATRALTETWSRGAALLFYAGHGAPGVWAHEPLLRGSQLATLKPMTGQPLIIALDCWDGYWMYPHNTNLGNGREAVSIGERATMGWGDRGAIAVFGPAGLGYLYVEEPMARAMMQKAFVDGERYLGELTQAGRLAIWSLNSGKYLARTYTLLGDPSMRLRLTDAP
ncbi:MAG TPA: C25 family cysteine peptidase [Anaerolineae bacterium]|nr:C25 family cysteine peptidase [Anaerolineae bacterium]